MWTSTCIAQSASAWRRVVRQPISGAASAFTTISTPTAIPAGGRGICCGILRCTSLCRAPRSGSQVLGADVPSFANFPYRAQEVLFLYRNFLRLIHRHYSPSERRDHLFRLRNEFASKRHLQGPKVISAALRRGEGLLAFQRQIHDSRETRQRSWSSKRNGAQSVDGLWDQLQMASGHVLPGLQHCDASLPISNGGYIKSSTSRSVYSRRR